MQFIRATCFASPILSCFQEKQRLGSVLEVILVVEVTIDNLTIISSITSVPPPQFTGPAKDLFTLQS